MSFHVNSNDQFLGSFGGIEDDGGDSLLASPMQQSSFHEHHQQHDATAAIAASATAPASSVGESYHYTDNNASFDSEGYGQKVADYRVEMTKLESELQQTLPAPMTPPPAHNPHAHAAHHHPETPVSASKFIERSLHDLDDLINQRRQELSELKRTNRQRLEATPTPAAAITTATTTTTTTTAAPLPPTALSPAVVSLSRVAYEELKENERILQNKLKAEQLRSSQLEDDLANMESQCAAHAERTKAAVVERNRCHILHLIVARFTHMISHPCVPLDWSRSARRPMRRF